MVPMSSPEPVQFSSHERWLLLKIARESINHGLNHGIAISVDADDYAGSLRHDGACFVTLKIDGELRGCVGSLTASKPMIIDTTQHAYDAAFEDHRFTKLTSDEFNRTVISISVLSSPLPMTFTDEDDLARQLRPNVDGVIMEEGIHRGTFLPAVWESLSEPHQFIDQLKLKAGFDPGYWSDKIKVSRYQAETFSE